MDDATDDFGERLAAIVEQYEPAFNAMPFATTIIDLHTNTVVWVNGMVAEFGAAPGDTFSTIAKSLGNTGEELALDMQRRLPASTRPVSVVVPLELAPGVFRWVRSTYWMLHEPGREGRFTAVLSMILHRPFRDDEFYSWLDSWHNPAIVIDRKNAIVVFANTRARKFASPSPDLGPRLTKVIRSGLDALPITTSVEDASGTMRRLVISTLEMPPGSPEGHSIIVAHEVDDDDRLVNSDTPLPIAAATGYTIPASLSRRERETVTLLLQGLRVESIAKDLYISPNTVRNHLRSIFAKLGVHSQSELIDMVRSR